MTSHWAHKVIKRYCEHLPHLHVVKSCFTALEAIEFLNRHHVALVFLDIHMPKLKGFRLPEDIGSPSHRDHHYSVPGVCPGKL